MEEANTLGDVTIRTRLRPGDIGQIIQLHGVIYAEEYGFNETFEAYVAGPLAEFVHRASAQERLWIAARDCHVIGCLGIVAASPEEALLRWFLVVPHARKAGLGHRLINEAVAFCNERRYKSLSLWTVSALTAAAHLYRLFGFEKVEEKPGTMWGVDVLEEKYELRLREH